MVIIYMRFFKDMIFRGKETINYNIVSLELGEFYEVEHIPYRFIRNAGLRAWRELNQENKELFNNGARNLNLRPIPRKFEMFPDTFDSPEKINDAVEIELT